MADKQITDLRERTGPLGSDVYLIVQQEGQEAQRRRETEFLQAASTTAASVSLAPAGGISATNVQAAVVELDIEKVPTARTVTGANGVGGGGALSGNLTLSLNVNGLGALTTVDSTADFIPIYDASAGTHVKVAPANIPAGKGTKFRIGTSVTSPANDTDYLDLAATFGYTIDSVTRRTNAGTATLSIRINGVVITGMSAIGVSSTVQTTNATGANTVSEGANVEYVTTNVSSVGRLWIWLNCTRT